jgi:hypothetical protein
MYLPTIPRGQLLRLADTIHNMAVTYLAALISHRQATLLPHQEDIAGKYGELVLQLARAVEPQIAECRASLLQSSLSDAAWLLAALDRIEDCCRADDGKTFEQWLQLLKESGEWLRDAVECLPSRHVPLLDALEKAVPKPVHDPDARLVTDLAANPAIVGADGMFLRRVGKVWHLGYQGERGDFPVHGNKFLGQLAKLLAKPNYAWTVAELRGDPDDKLKADAWMGVERASDMEALRAIHKEIQNIDAIVAETGSTEVLENKKEKLLRQVKGHSAKKRLGSSVRKAYNNVAAQKSLFLKKLEGKVLKKLEGKADMPQLAAHLRACIKSSGSDFTISYRPPAGMARWVVENPPT